MRVGSLCTGYGGLDMAVSHVFGARTSWISDVDAHVNVVLEKRFPDVPNLGDIRTVDWNDVEPIDILTAGYPCQPFSHAGKRKGTSDDRHLWPHIADAVRTLRPGLVVLENVAGHVSLGLRDVLGEMASVGYNAEWGCLRASDVGAPHPRKRLFIVAYPADADRGQRAVVGRRLWPDTERGGDDAASHTSGNGLQAQGRKTLTEPTSRHQESVAEPERWGVYAAAILRWEQLTRPAPPPTILNTKGDPRLSSEFVEWMMGIPEGWVTDCGLSKTSELKILGNGVVPQQAAAAITQLLDRAARS